MSQELLESSDNNEGLLNIRELLDMKQADLDHIMVDLSEEIAMWNLRMADLASKDTEESAAELRVVANEAIDNLDSQWPFMQDLMHISGKWHIADFSISGVAMKYPLQRQEAFGIAPSNGFAVYQLEDEPPTVGLSFVVGSVPVRSAAIQAHIEVLAYALPHEVSLYYVRPNSYEGAVSNNLDKFSDSLMYYDNLLLLHYSDMNSDFFRKSARQQKKFMLEIVDKISDSLPAPEYGVRAQCETVTTPYVYRRIEQGGKRIWQRISSSDGEPLLLAGAIDGVGVLESTELDNGKPLRSRGELVDADAGVCLVVQVEQCSLPDIFNSQPVYIPLRLVEDVEIALP